MSCDSCQGSYPVDEGVADFTGGDYFDSFDPEEATLSAAQQRALEDERAGTLARIADFYLPRLEALGARGEDARARLRVLDCGCGNGLSVDVLTEAGFEAWGNDSSRLRKWQWRERTQRLRLSVASGAALPFADGFFDAVICSGVLEHVGVQE